MNRRDFIKDICSLPVLAVLPLSKKITLLPEEEDDDDDDDDDKWQWCIPMWDASTKAEFYGLKDFITTGFNSDDGVIWSSTGDNSWVLTHSDKNPHCFIR